MENLEIIKANVLLLENKYKTVNGIFNSDIQDVVTACKNANNILAPKNEKFKISVDPRSKFKSMFAIGFTMLVLGGVAATLVHFGVVNFSIFRDATTDFTQQPGMFQTTFLPFFITLLFMVFIGLFAVYPFMDASAKTMDHTLDQLDRRFQRYIDKQYTTQLISNQMNKLNIDCLDLQKNIEDLKAVSNPEVNEELDDIYAHLVKTSQIYSFYSMMILSKINH